MKQVTYVVKDELGLHARPAGLLVKVTGGFKSDIRLSANGKEADGKRILGIMSLGVKKGDKVTFACKGVDEERAAVQIESFLNDNL
ncbi:HPr family phosphocarrier protein [Velocimicrobium porci]|uniref:HPr family phosphocarrier protein n=1 Tax=Velocimicrobium porci TaxID=2606634 RepID=A0A6L5Y1W5_9FIRM|nr:HPr family phosphocarrier protein [Velocimicrobium porci]MSS64919.1 HPr family phosphocarrier protein [Velocimicrobium porci]